MPTSSAEKIKTENNTFTAVIYLVGLHPTTGRHFPLDPDNSWLRISNSGSKWIELKCVTPGDSKMLTFESDDKVNEGFYQVKAGSPGFKVTSIDNYWLPATEDYPVQLMIRGNSKTIVNFPVFYKFLSLFPKFVNLVDIY